MSLDKWGRIDGYYNEAVSRAYYEGPSPHHRKSAIRVIKELCSDINYDSVVEFGCGVAPILDEMKRIGKQTFGITLFDEPLNHDVWRGDMHFSPLSDNSYHMAVSRHSLEHSPMPLFLLKEMYRISSHYALVVVPKINKRTVFTWPDHYSVLNKMMWEKLFRSSDWKLLKYKSYKFLKNEHRKWDTEHCWLLEKDI